MMFHGIEPWASGEVNTGIGARVIQAAALDHQKSNAVGFDGRESGVDSGSGKNEGECLAGTGYAEDKKIWNKRDIATGSQQFYS